MQLSDFICGFTPFAAVSERQQLTCLCVCSRRLQSKKRLPPLNAAVPADDVVWPVRPNQGLENHTQDCCELKFLNPDAFPHKDDQIRFGLANNTNKTSISTFLNFFYFQWLLGETGPFEGQ